MREVEAIGKTVEEATENGCAELGLSRDDVSVEIIDFPAKKIFKTIPAKVRVTAIADAAEEKPEKQGKPVPQKKPEEKVKAPEPQKAPVQEKQQEPPRKTADKVLPSEPEEIIDIAGNVQVGKAVGYLQSIFGAMGTGGVEITAVRQGDATLLRVEGDKIADKVEVRGEVIQALSYLIDRSVNVGIDKKDGEYLRVRLDVAGYRNRRESELIELANKTGKEVARTGRSRTLAPMNPYERLIVHTAISSMDGVTSESIGADTERRVVIKSLAPNATDGEDWKPGRREDGQGGRGSSGGSGRYDRGERRPGGGGRRGGRGGGANRGGGSHGGPQSHTPEREYADKPRDPNAQPVVPKRREALHDGEDLPLYGKIEL